MLRCFAILLPLFLSLKLQAQTTIPLYEKGQIPNARPTLLRDSAAWFPTAQGDSILLTLRVVEPKLTAYLPEKKRASGIGVVICPGGGYAVLAINWEGHSFARKLQAQGIAAFVLEYRLPNAELFDNKQFVPLQDAQRALQIVRENAGKWGLKPDKIGIMGSSAGGHLAATAGTHFDKAYIPNAANTNLRPDFMVLNYPVITFADSLTHGGSRSNLIGDAGGNLTEADKILFSNELQVNAQTPPVFITHAIDDEVVPVQNSLLFIAALQQQRVPVASFFYTRGGHGYAADNPFAELEWMDAAVEWMQALLLNRTRGSAGR